MNTPIQLFRRLFAKPSPLMIAQAELEETQRQLLQAQTAQEYAASMTAYHGARIQRLTRYIADAHKQETRHV